jgi:hypothetical protein
MHSFGWSSPMHSLQWALILRRDEPAGWFNAQIFDSHFHRLPLLQRRQLILIACLGDVPFTGSSFLTTWGAAHVAVGRPVATEGYARASRLPPN